MSDHIDIVFNGPPGHESGRFVEVENAQGKSINFGEWVKRPDGYWALRITRTALAAGTAEGDEAYRTACRLLDNIAPGLEKSDKTEWVINQIDNAIVGIHENYKAIIRALRNDITALSRALSEKDAENAKLRAALDEAVADPSCPNLCSRCYGTGNVADVECRICGGLRLLGKRPAKAHAKSSCAPSPTAEPPNGEMKMEQMICRCCGFDIDADAMTFDRSLYHDICGRKLLRERGNREAMVTALKSAQQLLADLVVTPNPSDSILVIYARARDVEAQARAALQAAHD